MRETSNTFIVNIANDDIKTILLTKTKTVRSFSTPTNQLTSSYLPTRYWPNNVQLHGNTL